MQENDMKNQKTCDTCRFEDKNGYPCTSCSNAQPPYEADNYSLMWVSVENPQISDSGERREFESGAVRDIAEGKGRCDLLPLDVLGAVMQDIVFTELENFVSTRQTLYLYKALNIVSGKFWNSKADMILDLAKHFEEGAKKYGEYNWQKGIPVHCYIDSAVRHYLKCLRGDKDEPHDRAFVWNIVCCIWTMMHKPEMDDLPKKGVTEND